MDTDGLVRLLLVLAVVWVALEVVGELLGLLLGPLVFLRPLLGLVLLAVVGLWLYRRL